MDYRAAKILLHNHEKSISFNDANHKYYSGDSAYISVTTLVRHFINIFDYSDSIARRKAHEAGVEVAEIKKKWRTKGKRSRELGTVIHSYAEYILANIEKFKENYDIPVYIKNIEEYNQNRFDEYKKYIDSLHDFIKGVEMSKSAILSTEALLHNDKFHVAGQADFILWNSDGTISIGDWKTNAKISNYGYGKKMRGGVGHLDDSKLNHYKLQLSIYKYILEKLGFTVSEIFLVHLKPDGFERINLDYLPAEAEYILKSNSGLYD